MPMIQAKITAPITEKQNAKLHTELTNAVVDIFHKPIGDVMVNIEPDADLWMAGEKLECGAYVSASLIGELKNADCDALTAKICEIFKQELGIDGQHVYATFQTINQWGWDGKIL